MKSYDDDKYLVAYYDETGVITSVEVRQSDDCHRLFERHFERMTWP